MGGTADITGDVSITGAIANTKNTQSTTSTTGAIVTAGGVGIAKNIQVGGTADITGNTKITGTLTITGAFEAGSSAAFKFGSLEVGNSGATTIEAQSTNTDVTIQASGSGKVVVGAPLKLDPQAYVACDASTAGMILYTASSTTDSVTICLRLSGSYTARTLSFA